MSSSTDLGVNFAGISLKNPIIAASGTFGYGVEFEDVVHLSKLGGMVVKGLSKEPMIGNPPPRLWETAAGMLNAIGLQNIGAPAFLEEKMPRLRQIKNIVVFANVFGYTREDYEHTIEILNDGEGIAAYELNVSCPNTAQGGLQFGSDPRLLDEVVTTAKRVAQRPLIVKLSPNVTSIAQTPCRWSTPSWPWRLIRRRASRASPTSRRDFRAPQSNPSRCAWSTTPRM